jgi:cytoskeletal protein RodZ
VQIGETLAAARRAAGLTVTEISSKTKIRVSIIEALERDDHALCGGDFYVRAHIRSIAQAIGIDPVPLISSYDQLHGWPADGPPARPPGTSTMQDRLWKLSQRYRPSWAVAAGLPLIAIIGYSLFALINGALGRSHPAAMIDDTPSPTHSAIVRHRAAAPIRKVEVRLYAMETSQVRVHNAAGKLLFEGQVLARSRQAWTDRERLTLTLDNAGVTQLTVNGKNLGRPGRNGQALRLSFGPGDPKATNPAKPKRPRPSES